MMEDIRERILYDVQFIAMHQGEDRDYCMNCPFGNSGSTRNTFFNENDYQFAHSVKENYNELSICVSRAILIINHFFEKSIADKFVRYITRIDRPSKLSGINFGCSEFRGEEKRRYQMKVFKNVYNILNNENREMEIE